MTAAVHWCKRCGVRSDALILNENCRGEPHDWDQKGPKPSPGHAALECVSAFIESHKFVQPNLLQDSFKLLSQIVDCYDGPETCTDCMEATGGKCSKHQEPECPCYEAPGHMPGCAFNRPRSADPTQVPLNRSPLKPLRTAVPKDPISEADAESAMMVLDDVHTCAVSWEREVCVVGNVRAGDIADAIQAVNFRLAYLGMVEKTCGEMVDLLMHHVGEPGSPADGETVVDCLKRILAEWQSVKATRPRDPSEEQIALAAEVTKLEAFLRVEAIGQHDDNYPEKSARTHRAAELLVELCQKYGETRDPYREQTWRARFEALTERAETAETRAQDAHAEVGLLVSFILDAYNAADPLDVLFAGMSMPEDQWVVDMAKIRARGKEGT